MPVAQSGRVTQALLRHLPATLSELRRTRLQTSVLPVICEGTDRNVCITRKDLGYTEMLLSHAVGERAL
jgi:hypothetical protein